MECKCVMNSGFIALFPLLLPWPLLPTQQARTALRGHPGYPDGALGHGLKRESGHELTRKCADPDSGRGTKIPASKRESAMDYERERVSRTSSSRLASWTYTLAQPPQRGGAEPLL